MACPMTPKSISAKAVLINRYGPPDVLTYARVELASLAPHEVRIRTLLSAVNHTDLEIRAGKWPVQKTQPFPYIPGVEVVGTIADMGSAVRDWTQGQTVITLMQGLGGVRAERSGGYAEFVTVAADALAPVPPSIDPAAMAAFGLAGVTAYKGLQQLGPLQGRRILVTGAAGGVGSAAIAIARAQGATVVCLVSRPAHIPYVLELGAGEVLRAERDGLAGLKAQSVDGVLDTVGGALFGPCVAALRAGGVLSLVGAVGGSNVGFDAWQLIKPVTLTGYSTESLDGHGLRAAIGALANGIASGAIRPLRHQIIPLQDAARAHALMERGGVLGRILLAPEISDPD